MLRDFSCDIINAITLYVICVLRENVPVIRQQPIAKDKPPPLITLDVICPLEHPSFVCIASWGWSGGLGLRHHSPHNQDTELRNLGEKIKFRNVRIYMIRLMLS